MTCIICGKSETSVPVDKSKWQVITLNTGGRYCACSDKLPEDSAPLYGKKGAYLKVFIQIVG